MKRSGLDSLLLVLKTKQLLLDEDDGYKTCKKIRKKIDIENVAAVLFFAKIFKLSSLVKLSLNFIERNLSLISDSFKLLELDIICIEKVLSSEELNIDSEMEIVNIIEGWLLYKIDERSKYAKRLLSKVRLPLLSVPALKYILNKPCFTANDSCVGVINKVIRKKTKNHSFNTTSRHCSQSCFDIVLFGGRSKKIDCFIESKVYKIDGNSFFVQKNQYSKKIHTKLFNLLCTKNELYVFGCLKDEKIWWDRILSVGKYSFASKTWEIFCDMHDDRLLFCACAFMNNAYLIGGSVIQNYLFHDTNSCLKLSLKDRKWTEAGRLNARRPRAACAVFQGRIVAWGGLELYNVLDTADVYDHVTDSWSNMPSMNYSRFNHKLVSVRSKLFVVGGGRHVCCEVFDLTCNKFVLLQPPTKFFSGLNFNSIADVVLIGCELVVFYKLKNKVLIYNTENNEWREKRYNFPKNLSKYNCALLPHLKQWKTWNNLFSTN